MLKYLRTLIVIILILPYNLAFSQSYKVIDYLSDLSGEIFKVQIEKIDTCTSYNTGTCTSSINSKVLAHIKVSKFDENLKILNFTHNADHHWKGVPKDKMLEIGKIYIVFVSTELLSKDYVKKQDPLNTYYGLVDYFFGVVEYNSDLENYLNLALHGSNKLKGK